MDTKDPTLKLEKQSHEMASNSTFHTILNAVDAAKQSLSDSQYKDIVEAIANARKASPKNKYVQVEYILVSAKAKGYLDSDQDMMAMLFMNANKYSQVWTIEPDCGCGIGIHTGTIEPDAMDNIRVEIQNNGCFMCSKTRSSGGMIEHKDVIIITKCEPIEMTS